MSRNLVVVRAGAGSLHGRWLAASRQARRFDLLVSFYDAAAFHDFKEGDGVRAVLVPGGKWDGLFRTLSEVDLGAYDYFWLPDDDIDADTRAINAIFDQARTHGLAVAQPALTRGSHFSHFIFSQCPGFRLRYTNYIEIMVPCLSQAVLRRSLPLFRDTMSGFGLDYVWCRWPESGPFRAAILDSVAVHHTRPVGSALKQMMQAAGRPRPELEEAELRARLGMRSRTVPLSYAGVLDDGQLVLGLRAMGIRMTRAWWLDRRSFRNARRARSGMARLLRRQFLRPLDMTPLEPPA